MTFLRLFTVTCLLPTIAEAASASASATSIADAIAYHSGHYEILKESYTKEGCQESWGNFPTRTTTSSMELATMDSKEKPCTCGMIYDSALTSLEVLREAEEEGNKDNEGDASIRTNSIFIDIPFAPSEETRTETAGAITTTKPTALESWIMARTPNSNTVCSKGFAGDWPCKNVDLIAHLPLNSFLTTDTSKPPDSANDLWGWTHESETGNREFVIWSVREGFYFFEVTGFDPILLGYLPPIGGLGAFQGDVKVLADFAYMGSEADAQGVQIFDLKRLLTIDPQNDCVNDKYCQQLKADQLYNGNSNLYIGRSHNIVVNEDNPNFVYVVGASRFGSCLGGLHVIDVSDPTNPTTAGCFENDGYVHDAQCVNYNGPDSFYKDSEICFCYNEDTVTILDVTDKSDMKIVSKISYGKTAYTHQGWLSTDHTHIVVGDEYDEYFGQVGKTRTVVVNVEDLRNPGDPVQFLGRTRAVDHNQYIVKATAEGQGYNFINYRDTDLIYQANYRSGLQILQVIDYETADFVEVGYFDTYPSNDNPRFTGAWSVYPFFRSGLVAISSIEEGLFLVKPNLKSSLVPPSEKNCSDDPNFQYQNKNFKDCEWVGNAKTPKKLRKRCRFAWEGTTVKNYCRETCGKAGFGPCEAELAGSRR
jgi:choice-of-anchor B domain-containing protein